MRLDDLHALLRKALKNGEREIISRIKKARKGSTYVGIEKGFQAAFEDTMRLYFKNNVPVRKVGARNYFPYDDTRTRSRKGFVDCVAYDDRKAYGFEYKAIEIPSLKNGRFYMVQVAHDFMRLNTAKRLNEGYVIGFVYGDLLKNMSERRLYQTFANQMFDDFKRASSRRPIEKKVWTTLGWDVELLEARVPHFARVAKVGTIGAVCVDCRVH